MDVFGGHYSPYWIMLEKSLESPLGSKEIKSVNPKGNQHWIFIGRTDAEAPILWPPDAKSWLLGKDPDARKNWGQREKGTTEDEMVGWHHWLMSLSKLRDIMMDRESRHAAVHGVTKSQTWLSNWTTTTAFCLLFLTSTQPLSVHLDTTQRDKWHARSITLSLPS